MLSSGLPEERTHGILKPDDTAGPLPTNSRKDLKELQASVEGNGSADEADTSDEATPLPGPPAQSAKVRRGRRKLSRPELERYASRILRVGKGDGEEETFIEKIGRILREAGVKVPTLTVEYRGLSVEADALVGTGGIPTLPNAAVGFIKGCIGLAQSRTQKLQILKDVTGKLEPYRTTLLLGPPGAGKSVFLKTLAGKMEASSCLRTTGDVKYNGARAEEFILQRTAAYAMQTDDHIPQLSVHETLAFAHTCQTSQKETFNVVDAIREARARNKDSNLPQRLSFLQRQHAEDMMVFEAGVGAPALSLRRTAEQLHPAAQLPDLDDIAEVASDGAPEAAPSLPAQPPAKAAGGGSASQEDRDFEELLASVLGTGVKTEVLIRIMGLQPCMDTVVGDKYLRGVSGGERKRVTSAELLVGPRRFLLLDEISTGLDSATTFSVVKYLATATHMLGLTTVISLLQPPPEVFYLFDDALVLTDGQVCFHGPVRSALPFFASLGFPCPLRKDPASFLQEVTTPRGQLVFASTALKDEKGGDLNRFLSQLMVSVDDIAAAFWQTKHGCQMREDLDRRPFRKEEGHPLALVKEKYALSWPQAFRVVVARQWLLTLRNAALVKGRIVQVVIMALIIGSLYSGLQHTSADARSYFGLSFLCIMILAMGSMPELSTTIATKSVLYKQRDLAFFQPSTYAVAMFVCRLPFMFVEAGLFCCIIYFWDGFYAAPGYFFLFYFNLIGIMNTMAAIMRLNACVSPDAVVAQALGGLLLLVLVITSGFAIVRQAIPGWWIWAYYISPFAYAVRAVVINEMTSPQWAYPNDPALPNGPSAGVASLESFGFFLERKWIYIGLFYNVGMSLILTATTAAALRFIHPPKDRPTLGTDKKELAEKATALQPRASFVTQMSRRLIKTPSAKSVEPADLEEEGDGLRTTASSLPFTPITLVFRQLKYYVPAPPDAQGPNADPDNPQRLLLLKGIEGYTYPTGLQALMGSSGAGKTTLMDVIAGRKTIGHIEGEILVNGHPKDQKSWSRVVGYVEQQDIASPQATVLESLVFSARLRLPESVTKAQLTTFVNEVVDIVELGPIAGKVVGVPGASGLSVEQRKRLTIAIELVSNPSVIFMDEPTSGLDARAAAIVMRAVKNVSRNNRTVMVTIHQPSIDIFETFESLILLQRGGKLIYFGSLGQESCDLIRYLEAVPGVPRIQPGENPATWMLEVTGGASITGSSKAAAQDFAELYKASELAQQNAAVTERFAEEGKRTPALHMDGLYATSKLTQLRALVVKFSISYWRAPTYNLVRIVLTLAIALFYGTMYLNQGKIPKEGATIANVQNVLGVLYSATQFQGMFNLMTVLPIVGFERAVLYRERSASMYSTLPYTTAIGVVEIPYLILQMALFVPVSYWLIGFRHTAANFFFYCLAFVLSIALFTFFGQLLVFLTPSQAMAQILAGALSGLWNMFNGFVLPYNSIPRGWKWLNRITPTTWIIYTLAANQLCDLQQPLTTPGGQVTTVSQYMDEAFGYKSDFQWWAMLIVAAYVVGFSLLAAVTVRFVSYQRR